MDRQLELVRLDDRKAHTKARKSNGTAVEARVSAFGRCPPPTSLREPTSSPLRELTRFRRYRSGTTLTKSAPAGGGGQARKEDKNTSKRAAGALDTDRLPLFSDLQPDPA